MGLRQRFKGFQRVVLLPLSCKSFLETINLGLIRVQRPKISFVRCLLLKFMCGFCRSFTFDDEKGDLTAELPSGTKLEEIPQTWRCPVCGHWKGNLKEISEQEFIPARAKYERNYPPANEKPVKDITYYRDMPESSLRGSAL